jgi:hypothetical protein
MVRQREETAVLANQVLLDDNWGGPCLVYNVFIRPDAAGQAGLAQIQRQALGLEPALLRVPPPALHLTAVFLLGLYEEFDRPREELWQEFGPRWLDQLTGLAAVTPPFELCFRQVVATRAGIIAIADEPNGLTAFRRAVPAVLDALPGKTGYSRELAHVTLFRYQTPLDDPARLLHWLSQATFQAKVEVADLVVAREHTYPFLGYDVLATLPLGGDA